MSGIAKLRALGVGWTIAVSVVLMVVEPALRNGVLAAGMVMLAAGWLMLAGLLEHAASQAAVGAVRRADVDRLLLTEAADALIRCSQAFGEQFDEIRAELLRAEQLSAEAVARLIDSFQAMVDQSRRQEELGLLMIGQSDGNAEFGGFSQDITFALKSRQDVGVAMENVGPVNRPASQTISELQQIAQAMQHNAGQAIVSLQFQDLLTQLIGHVTQRLDALQEIVCAVAGAGSAVDLQARLRGHLDGIHTRLDTLRDKTRNNPVRQTDFAGGEVELF